MKILTISIAAYNIEHYISKAIESVIEPSIIDKLEIIVENDGSTDKTSEIAEKYVKMYPDSIKVVNKENGGYGSTINKSISLATGKYFKQLDGDDRFITANLSDFIMLLQDCDADYVMTPYVEFYEGTDDSKIIDPCKDHAKGMFSFEDYNITEDVSMHSLCIKTEVLKRMDMCLDTHCLYTDIEFCTFPVKKASSYYIFDKPIYLYRLGNEGQSVSKSSIMKHFDDFLRVLNHVIDFYYSIPDDMKGQKRFILAHASAQVGCGMRYLFYYPFSMKNKKRIKKYIHEINVKYPEVLRETLRRYKLAKALVYTDCLAYPLLKIYFSI